MDEMTGRNSDTFYGDVDAVHVLESGIVIRCIREFYHGDGLLANDVWVWTITGCTQAADAEGLRGKPVWGFELDGTALRVWLDEWQESVTLQGTSVSKVEEPRSHADLVGLVAGLTKRLSREEAEEVALRRRIRDTITSIEQKIDRLRRRDEFESRKTGHLADHHRREIEDLTGIVSRLQDALKSVCSDGDVGHTTT